jgi:hypothetical protein
MKFILLLVLCSLGAVTAQAQSHNPGPNSNCLLNKNVWLNSEKMVCPACEKKKENEKEARVAEDKRRMEALVAKAEADKIAFEKARLDKIAEDAKNAEASKVYINASPISANTTSISTTKPDVVKVDSLVVTTFYENSSKTFGIKNLKGEILFEPQFYDVEEVRNPNSENRIYATLNNTLKIFDLHGVLLKTVTIPDDKLKIKDVCYETGKTYLEHLLDKKTLYENFTFHTSTIYIVENGSLSENYKYLYIGNFKHSDKSFDTLWLTYTPGESKEAKLAKLEQTRQDFFSQGFTDRKMSCK